MKKKYYLKSISLINGFIDKKVIHTLLLVVLLYFILAFQAYGQRIEIEKVSSSENVSDIGIFYALPKSILVVDVEITKEVYKAPKDSKLCKELFGDCDNFFGGKNLPYKNGEKFKISDMKVYVESVIDVDHIYKVNARKKWNKDKGLNFTLSENGIIKGATASSEDKSFDIILSSLSAITSIIRSSSPSAMGKEALEDNKLDPTKLKLKKRILDLLSKRENLISSPNYATTKETLEFQINELNKIIAKDLGIILGLKSVKKKIFTFEINDFESKINNTIYSDTIFKIVNKSKNSGVNVMKKFEQFNFIPEEFRSESKTGKIDDFIIQIEKSGISLGEKLSTKITTDDNERKGLAYRIPGGINVKIFNGKLKEPNEKKEIFRGGYLIAQLGSIAYMPYKIDSATLEYYENLGWLKSVNLTSTSISPERINNASSTLKNLRDVINPTEAEDLAKKIELIKLRNEYRELLNNEN